jgi:hypothetical protein
MQFDGLFFCVESLYFSMIVYKNNNLFHEHDELVKFSTFNFANIYDLFFITFYCEISVFPTICVFIFAM